MLINNFVGLFILSKYGFCRFDDLAIKLNYYNLVHDINILKLGVKFYIKMFIKWPYYSFVYNRIRNSFFFRTIVSCGDISCVLMFPVSSIASN